MQLLQLRLLIFWINIWSRYILITCNLLYYRYQIWFLHFFVNCNIYHRYLHSAWILNKLSSPKLAVGNLNVYQFLWISSLTHKWFWLLYLVRCLDIVIIVYLSISFDFSSTLTLNSINKTPKSLIYTPTSFSLLHNPNRPQFLWVSNWYRLSLNLGFETLIYGIVYHKSKNSIVEYQ